MNATSGGAYYATAVQLRADAAKARANYAEALETVGQPKHGTGWAGEYASALHPAMLIVQAVGLEVAAAVYCLAQAVEDGRA